MAGEYFLKLLDKLSDKPQFVVAEIGVKAGRTSETLLSDPRVMLLMVDPWKWVPGYDRWNQAQHDEHFKAARERAARYPDRTVLYRGTSEEALQNRPHDATCFDMVILDADHSRMHVLNDLVKWTATLVPGGIMSGRFYGPTGIPGVTQAVDKYVSLCGAELQTDPVGHGWHFVKPDPDHFDNHEDRRTGVVLNNGSSE